MSSANKQTEAELSQAQKKLYHVLARQTKWERLQQIM